MRPDEHQLQINNSGAWKTIVWWPRDDDERLGNALNAALMLRYIDPLAKFRIATHEAYPRVLRRLDYTTGGRWRRVEREA